MMFTALLVSMMELASVLDDILLAKDHVQLSDSQISRSKVPSAISAYVGFLFLITPDTEGALNSISAQASPLKGSTFTSSR
jgi:hypothetical protein